MIWIRNLLCTGPDVKLSKVLTQEHNYTVPRLTVLAHKVTVHGNTLPADIIQTPKARKKQHIPIFLNFWMTRPSCIPTTPRTQV